MLTRFGLLSICFIRIYGLFLDTHVHACVCTCEGVADQIASSADSVAWVGTDCTRITPPSGSIPVTVYRNSRGDVGQGHTDVEREGTVLDMWVLRTLKGIPRALAKLEENLKPCTLNPKPYTSFKVFTTI